MGYYSGIDRTHELEVPRSELIRALADGIDIVELLRDEGYDPYLTKDGDMVDIANKTGWRKHHGEYASLWKVIAPYVNEGAIVYFEGEGGDRWRILFTEQQAFEQIGTTTYG